MYKDAERSQADSASQRTFTGVNLVHHTHYTAGDSHAQRRQQQKEAPAGPIHHLTEQ